MGFYKKVLHAKLGYETSSAEVDSSMSDEHDLQKDHSLLDAQ